MALNLSERQRAMLEEMHITVWSRPAPVTPHAGAPNEAGVVAQAATAAVQLGGSAAAAAASAASAASSASSAAANLQPAATSLPSATQAAPVTAPVTAPITPPVTPPIASAPTALASTVHVTDLDWGQLQTAVQSCRACGLHAQRQHIVWGHGAAADAAPPQADWLVVGSAPTGSDETQGQPFTGDEGVLLDNILRAVGAQRGGGNGAKYQVFLTQAIKCRPSGDRPPHTDEVTQCLPHLERQVALLRPRVIVALGLVAAQALLRQQHPEAQGQPLGRLRAQVWQHQGIPLVVSYPPAYLLRNTADKAKAWADWCLALSLLRS